MSSLWTLFLFGFSTYAGDTSVRYSATAAMASVLQPDDRIVFVGDSITMQGIRGWCQLVDKSLTQAHPELGQTVVAIASSGQTVGSWINVEKQSREPPVIWKIPQALDVGKALDKKADVLVIMLGMNDVLGPRVVDTEAGYTKWKESYRELIIALRQRCEPPFLQEQLPVLKMATVPRTRGCRWKYFDRSSICCLSSKRINL